MSNTKGLASRMKFVFLNCTSSANRSNTSSIWKSLSTTAVSAEVPDGDTLREHVPILHLDSQPQLEPLVFRDEGSQARTKALARPSRNSARLASCAFGVALDE